MPEIYLIWIINDETGDEDLFLAVPDIDTAEAYMLKNPLEAPEHYFIAPINYLEK
jgi:hypothetical protein